MYTVEFVTLVVSLMVLGVVALLRGYLGQSKASEMLDWAQGSVQSADLFLVAAKQAVNEVEFGIKRQKDLTDEELKAEAVRIMADILKTWGVYVDEKALTTLLALIETAYRQLKEVKSSPLYKVGNE